MVCVCVWGGGSESLILAPWSKVEEWHPHPPPSAVNLVPLKFSPLEPLGPPGRPGLLVLEWCRICHVNLSFSFLFSFSPLFLLFFFPFSFLWFFFFLWRTLLTRVAEAPKAPQDTPLNIVSVFHYRVAHNVAST